MNGQQQPLAALGDRIDYQGGRIDELEAELAHLAASVELVAAAAPAGGQQPPDSFEAQYDGVQEWVAAEFCHLAAPLHTAGGRWCLRWADNHPGARRRLQLLWQSWEATHRPGGDPAAQEEWLRLVFDHHAPLLLSQSGPFAGCSATHTGARCAAPPPMPGAGPEPLPS